MSKEVDPRLVFERLFGDNTPEGRANRAKRAFYNRSILDSVAENARDLRRQLGVHDGRKLDEYLTCVREIERRIAPGGNTQPAISSPTYAKPTGIPADFPEHIRLMCDLMVLAMQGDLTRVITFVMADEGSNRAYPFLGVPEGHHDISHHQNDPEKQKKDHRDQSLPRHAVRLFARADGRGRRRRRRRCSTTRWSSTAAAFPTAIATTTTTCRSCWPAAGRARFAPAATCVYKRETPMTNLYLAMLDRLGAADRPLRRQRRQAGVGLRADNRRPVLTTMPTGCREQPAERAGICPEARFEPEIAAKGRNLLGYHRGGARMLGPAG